MESIMTFFNMGGYAGFVWPSYGVTAIVLVVLLVSSRKFLKSQEAILASLRGDSGSDKK